MEKVTPKSILQDEDDTYPDDSVGFKYKDRLLALSNNDVYWKQRLGGIKSFQDRVKSTRFRRLISEKSPSKLQAVCNVAYLMKAEGEDAGRVPDNVLTLEKDEYGEDVGNGCSVCTGMTKQPEGGNEEPKKDDKKKSDASL